jgi:hypothetical protein
VESQQVVLSWALSVDWWPMAGCPSAMFSGHGLEFGRSGIGPGQKLIEATVGMAIDDAG